MADLKQDNNTEEVKDQDSGQNTEEIDSKKRTFMKLAGTVGVGMLAASLLPQKAEALVFGSSPTSNNVGLRNSSNVKINPATEDTLASVKTQTDKLTFDAGSNPANLKVNLAAIGSNIDIGLTNVANTPINPATEDTLALIRSQTDKLTFSGSNLLTSGGSGGGAVTLQDTTGTTINPATEDSSVYLRRMVKLMESQAAVDSANRQRVAVESAVISSGTITTVTTVTTVSTVSAVTAVTNLSSLAGWNQQMFQDVARNAYATGLRQNLLFS